MIILKEQKELKIYLAKLNSNSIGFVPTMGALHEGHLKLVEQAKSQCDTTICSIFINPTQFNNDKDLENYPRTLNSDLTKLKELFAKTFFVSLKSPIWELWPTNFSSAKI